MENVAAQNTADLRDRFRIVQRNHATVSGPAPCASIPGGIENAFRNAITSRPTYDTLFPLRNPRLPPKKPAYASDL